MPMGKICYPTLSSTNIIINTNNTTPTFTPARKEASGLVSFWIRMRVSASSAPFINTGRNAMIKLILSVTGLGYPPSLK